MSKDNLKKLTESLNTLISDEDLTSEKLQEASESLLPNLADELNNLFRSPRQQIYDAIDTERDFQDEMTSRTDRPDIIENMHVGDILSAIQYNLNQASAAWYKGSTPHPESMHFLRKIAGLCVKAGEINGMPPRGITKNSI